MNLTQTSRIFFQQKSAGTLSFKRAFWERSLDIIIGFTALVILSPLLIPIGIAIKLKSPGPLIFKQRRIGYKGRSFMIFKFRTMQVGCETTEHESHTTNLIATNSPMIKLDAAGDKRLIPLGRFLRATAIDELPQLINVLKGDMSIVGPRPCLPSEYSNFKNLEARFETPPGMTGLWQVSGKNHLTFSQMVDCDIIYARRKNIWTYLKIIFQTPRVLVEQLQDSRRKSNLVQMPLSATTTIEKEAIGQ